MNRQRIKFGTKFPVQVSNTGEHEFEVLNFHEKAFDRLICNITNTTSFPPPEVYISDESAGIIKAKFNAGTPPGKALELLIQRRVAQTVITEEKKVLLDGESVKKAASGSWAIIKNMFWGFLIASLFLLLIKGTYFGDIIVGVWSKLNAAKVASAVSDFDPRILTNDHPVYKTAAFTQYNTNYKHFFGPESELRELYAFVGEDFFVTKDLIKNSDGSYFLATKSDADAYCEEIGARLPSPAELDTHLPEKYLNIENFTWPVNLRSNVPEWTGEKESWDNYWLYLKDGKNPIKDEIVYLSEKKQTKLVSADNGDYRFAFRCVFSERYYAVDEE